MTATKPEVLTAEEFAQLKDGTSRRPSKTNMVQFEAAFLDRIIATLDQRTAERDGEREARERIDVALRAKDAAMGELFRRLSVAGVDCSDLVS